MASRILLRSRGVAAVVFPLLVASSFAFTVVACATLKKVDDPADAAVEAGDEQTPVTEDASTVDSGQGDSALPDSGAPLLDFECPTDPWTKVTKLKTECAPRQVKLVESPSPADVRGVSIARTPAGRVGIVYNAEQGADTGELHLVHFTPATPTYPPPKLLTIATGFAFHDGYSAKIAASAPDTLQVLSYDMDDSSQTGEVHLRKLVAGTLPLTTSLLIATGVKSPTELAFASDPAGNTVAAYRLATVGATAKLASKQGTPAGVFTALPDLTTTLHPGAAPGVGAGSLVVDQGGQAHFLYHYNNDALAPQFTTPRYHTLAGNVWSTPKTIDNNAPDGVSGFSASLAVFGTKKYAALFFVKAVAPGTITADLRLISWDASADVPTVEILDSQIPLMDPLYPAYRVAIAVDKFGLVHVALLRPTDAAHKNGYLEYRRQTRQPGGGTKWLSDIVDPTVFSEFSSAFVDMVVDDKARPHIAYRSGKDDNVYYATRFDR